MQLLDWGANISAKAQSLGRGEGLDLTLSVTHSGGWLRFDRGSPVSMVSRGGGAPSSRHQVFVLSIVCCGFSFIPKLLNAPDHCALGGMSDRQTALRHPSPDSCQSTQTESRASDSPRQAWEQSLAFHAPVPNPVVLRDGVVSGFNLGNGLSLTPCYFIAVEAAEARTGLGSS